MKASKLLTRVQGSTFEILGEFEPFEDLLIPFGWRELYCLGEHRTLGGVSVRHNYEATQIVFFGWGILSDFSGVNLTIQDGKDTKVVLPVKLESPYILYDAQTAIIRNESGGKKPFIVVTRERPASTHDRSRR